MTPTERQRRLNNALEEIRRGSLAVGLDDLILLGGEARAIAEAIRYRDELPGTSRNVARP